MRCGGLVLEAGNAYTAVWGTTAARIKSATINPFRDPGRQIGATAHERLRLNTFVVMGF
jgi:hypothetical protein